MRFRPLEVKAVESLLQQDWSGSDELAKAIIEQLETMRRDRVDYVVVYRIGTTVPSYLAVGPYAGRDAAKQAVNGHLSALEVSAYVVAPLRTHEAFKGLISEVDKMPEGSKDWAEVRRDALAFKNGWRGSKSPGRREDYLGR